MTRTIPLDVTYRVAPPHPLLEAVDLPLGHIHYPLDASGSPMGVAVQVVEDVARLMETEAQRLRTVNARELPIPETCEVRVSVSPPGWPAAKLFVGAVPFIPPSDNDVTEYEATGATPEATLEQADLMCDALETYVATIRAKSAAARAARG
jgi:hypothetical protein